MSATLDEALDRLGSLRLAVVGDLMLDRFVFGQIERISPEAPVPVVHVRSEQSRIGGAGNVARNAVSLGVGRVELVGSIGDGPLGDELLELVEQAGVVADGILRSEERLTTVKTRILGGGQQVVRIDRESTGPLPAGLAAALVARVKSLDADVVIVSDYAKGMVNAEVMDALRTTVRDGVPVVCDPKQGDFSLYRETTCITPNAREAASAAHAEVVDDATAESTARSLLDRLRTRMVLLTRGEQGMTLVRADGPAVHLPTRATEVYDVTGAGDTVIAIFAALLGAGADPDLAARAANAAAGVVIRELGTATISGEELRRVAGDS